MVMYAKIRRMFFREHLSISEIARRTTLTRNTIKKWLKAADGSEPKYRRPPKLTKLTPFEPKILMALVADAHRPKRDRRNALMLFKEIQQDGFTGSYTRVTEFIRHWRNQSAFCQHGKKIIFSHRISVDISLSCIEKLRWTFNGKLKS